MKPKFSLTMRHGIWFVLVNIVVFITVFLLVSFAANSGENEACVELREHAQPGLQSVLVFAKNDCTAVSTLKEAVDWLREKGNSEFEGILYRVYQTELATGQFWHYMLNTTISPRPAWEDDIYSVHYRAVEDLDFAVDNKPVLIRLESEEFNIFFGGTIVGGSFGETVQNGQFVPNFQIFPDVEYHSYDSCRLMNRQAHGLVLNFTPEYSSDTMRVSCFWVKNELPNWGENLLPISDLHEVTWQFVDGAFYLSVYFGPQWSILSISIHP